MFTLDELKSVVRYEPETGEIVYLKKTANRTKAGDRAGWVNRTSGYRQISVFCRAFQEHRLVWFYMTGEWPAFIDHIDGERANNRWSNLRSVSKSVNAENQHKAKANNKTGFLGVHRQSSGRFNARIDVRGKPFHLGTFDSPEEAHSAYLTAKRQLHAGCTI